MTAKPQGHLEALGAGGPSPGGLGMGAARGGVGQLGLPQRLRQALCPRMRGHSSHPEPAGAWVQRLQQAAACPTTALGLTAASWGAGPGRLQRHQQPPLCWQRSLVATGLGRAGVPSLLSGRRQRPRSPWGLQGVQGFPRGRGTLATHWVCRRRQALECPCLCEMDPPRDPK